MENSNLSGTSVVKSNLLNLNTAKVSRIPKEKKKLLLKVNNTIAFGITRSCSADVC